jgi:uncharacterized Zn finger protein
MNTVRKEWGLACPNCGSDEHLEVELATMARLTPDGPEPPLREHYWDEGSYMRCEACGTIGYVKSFRAAMRKR